MPDVNGLVTSVQWVAQATSLTAAAAAAATVLAVETTIDFDNAGGDLEINGVRYVYTASDEDAGTITLASGLAAAAAVDDVVLAVAGGQVAVDYTAFVTLGEGEDVEVLIDYADRALWPEGVYPDPVPVILSPDLTRIIAVPGRTPVIHGVAYETDSEGSRIAMRPDEAGGIIESFSGLADETPGVYDPSAYLGVPSTLVKTGTTPGLAATLIRMWSGPVYAPVLGGGGMQLLTGDLAVLSETFTTYNVLKIQGEAWHTLTITAPFTAVSGQTPQYRLDAAGNAHVRGAVSRVTASSGDPVFTLPTGYWPTAAWSVAVRTGTAGTFGRLDIDTSGVGRLFFAGTPTSLGLETVFSTL